MTKDLFEDAVILSDRRRKLVECFNMINTDYCYVKIGSDLYEEDECFYKEYDDDGEELCKIVRNYLKKSIEEIDKQIEEL